MNRSLIGGVALILGAALIWAGATALFTVNQVEQAIVLQLGEYKTTIEEPGLHIKVPWPFQDVVYFDRRVLDVEPPTEEVIAADQKRLVVDSYGRWRIADPLQFYRSMGSEHAATSRLSNIISASLRRVLGNVTLASVLSDKRAGIMREITQEVAAQAKPFGITVIDVRLRRADLPEENSQAIYSRMQSERQREAQEFRAEGDENAQRIRASAEKDRTVILAQAQRQSQILRGEGEGAATRIYADAFGQDPGFFTFYRSMQAYREALGASNTTLVLSPDSEFFRYFGKSAGGKGP